MVQSFQKHFILKIGVLILLSGKAHAEVLFEGYYKILLSGQHIGFVVQRFSFDVTKKQFEVVSLTKQKDGNFDYTDSLKATSKDDLTPIAYEYTNVVNKKSKAIDVSYKKGLLVGSVKNGSEKAKINLKIPQGTFFSNFLVYMILKSPSGLKESTSYKYKAVFEESAEIGDGEAIVEKKENWNGVPAFKVINKFGNQKYINYITEKGEVLSSVSDSQPLAIELVASPEEATQGIEVKPAILKSLFGDAPKGSANIMSIRRSRSGGSPKPSKQFGVSGGQGIQIKATESDQDN